MSDYIVQLRCDVTRKNTSSRGPACANRSTCKTGSTKKQSPHRSPGGARLLDASGDVYHRSSDHTRIQQR